MTSDSKTSTCSDDDCIPLQITVHPADLARLEARLAGTGRTAQEVIESVVTRAFGPLGGRIER